MTNLYPFLSVLGILGGLLTTVAGAWAYKKRAGVDMEVKKESATLNLQSEPLKIALHQLEVRESELTILRQQDQNERRQYIETLGAMKRALEEIATDVRAHREEERERSAKLYEQFKGLGDRLLVIETQLKVENAA
jgi:hypothetical protein